MNKPILMEIERAILQNIDEEIKWIAKDFGGDIYGYKEKPIKKEWRWSSQSTNTWLPFTNLFKFITWDDEEPYLIEDLLKDDQEDDK